MDVTRVFTRNQILTMIDEIASQSQVHHGTPASMAAPETHPAVMALFKQFVSPGARVADLGAGQGALSVELESAGYDVVAVDVDRSNWKADRIPLKTCNLDREFADDVLSSETKFDAVAAVEIIEHLENPFQFIRECAKLLKPGGLLFVTTPNADCVYSRIVFFYTGRLNGFAATETLRPAHITPIFKWKFDLMFSESNFETISESFAPYAFNSGTNMKVKAAFKIAKLIEPFVKGDKGDASRLMVARLAA